MPATSTSMRRSLLAATGALALAFGGWSALRAVGEGTGLPMAAGGQVDPPSASVQGAVPDAAPAGRAPVQVSATELFQQYQGSQGRAGGKYQGQRLALSGVLSEVEQGAGGVAVLSLSAGPDLERIRAVMKPAEQAKAVALSAGTRVSLDCLHQGTVMGEPVLGDCVIQNL